MTDLQRQFKILYHLYESFNKNELETYDSLKSMNDLKYIPDEEFKAELVYLVKSGYVEETSSLQLKLSPKGVNATQLLVKNIIAYIRKNYAKELSYWINNFDYWKSKTSKLVSEVYFRIEHEPEIRNASSEYLKSIDSIENIESYWSPPHQTIYNIRRNYIRSDKVMVDVDVDVDVFRDIHNATIINKSLVENSFNKVKREIDEETSKALVKVAEIIEKSGNASAGLLFDKFNEELNKPQPEKSRLSDFWSGIVAVPPSVATLAGAVSKITGLFG